MSIEELSMCSEDEITAAEALLLLSSGSENVNVELTETHHSDDPPEDDLEDDDDGVGMAARTRSKTRKALCSSMAAEEIDMYQLPPKKRQRSDPSSDLDSDSDSPKKAKNVKRENLDQGPIPPPELPENFRAVIDAMGGTGETLVVQKRLTATDVSSHQNRLQIPFSLLFNDSDSFLTDAEKDLLEHKDESNRWNHIETPLLDPGLESHTVPLRKWVMNKSSGGRTQVYVLNNPWIEIVWINGLEGGDVVQLWAFRVGQQLHLALVKLDE